MNEVRFDDIAALEALRAQGFSGWSESLPVTQPMIQAFADITDDHQWIHTDPERAQRESPFGGAIAHGFLTLAMATTVNRASGARVVGHRSALNYGLDGVRFLSPVPAGNHVQGRARIDAIEAKANGTLLTKQLEVRVEESGKLAVVLKWKLLYLP